MTAPRRQRKRFGIHAAAAVALALTFGSAALQAATTERVVLDPRTGLALSGYDPVAYYTDGSARLGKPEFEYEFAGATWRFRNEGNRGAFKDDPTVYMPQFGGYDPTAIARGAPVPGHPQFWLRYGDRIVLFYSARSRGAFAASPDAAMAAAERRWPEVEGQLAR